MNAWKCQAPPKTDRLEYPIQNTPFNSPKLPLRSANPLGCLDFNLGKGHLTKVQMPFAIPFSSIFPLKNARYHNAKCSASYS